MQEQEIVALIKRSKLEAQAMTELLEFFKPKVNAIVRGYSVMGADHDDLTQEGMIGLYNAITSYDETKNHNFGVYATLCIHNKIQNVIRSSKRRKNAPLNTYLSIDENDEDDEDTISFVVVDDSVDIEQQCIDKELKMIALSRVKDLLTQEQFAILKMFLNGYKYSDMAKKVNKTSKDIDNALQAIKKKLAIIKEEIR